jgi:hypothetical protein
MNQEGFQLSLPMLGGKGLWASDRTDSGMNMKNKEGMFVVQADGIA